MDIFSAGEDGSRGERPLPPHRFGVLDEAGPEDLRRAALVEHDHGYRASMACVGASYRPVGRTEACDAAADTAKRAADVFGVPCIPYVPWQPGPSSWDAAA